MHSLKETLCKTLDDIFCDICGGSCKKMIDDEAFNIESACLSANWGYGSQSDGETYRIDICEGCFQKTIGFLNNNRTVEPPLAPLNT